MNRQFNNNLVSGVQLENMTKLRLDAREKLMPILNNTNLSYLDKRN